MSGEERVPDDVRRDLPKKDGRYQPFEGCEQISVGTLGGLFPYGVVPVDDPYQLAAALKRDLPKKDGRYQPMEGSEQISVGTLGGLFPYGVVPVDDPYQLAAVEFFDKNGIVMGNMYNVGTRICTWYAAWTANAFARLGRGEDACRNLRLANQSVGFFDEIFEINEPAYRSCPWCQAPQATFVQTVHEMLLRCEGNRVVVAPAVPKAWTDYAFRLRAPGRRTVEAKCVNGKLESKIMEEGK